MYQVYRYQSPLFNYYIYKFQTEERISITTKATKITRKTEMLYLNTFEEAFKNIKKMFDDTYGMVDLNDILQM